MKSLIKFSLAILISQGYAGMAFANGFSLLDQDAFATGRGEAFVATADNPSAIYYNPAGIAQLDGNNLRGGIYGIYLDNAYSPPAGAPNSGNTYHSSDHLAAVPQGFYTHTFKDSILSVGLGLYAPYGGSIDWPQDSGFRTVATEGKLTYLSISPVAALKLAPGLFVGIGFIANYVNIDLAQGLRPAFQPPNVNYYQFKGDGWSYGYNIGALLQPIEQLSFGLTFRSDSEVNLKGRSKFEQFSAHVPQTTLPAQMSLTFPLEVIGGVSYRPTPKWNVEFDAHYIDWDTFGNTSINQSGAFPLGASQDVPVTLDWRQSWVYELGATRYLENGWHVSAGYVFNEDSVSDAFYSPLAADMDRDFFSVGVGRNGKRFDFDIAYQFGYGPGHTVNGSTPSTPLGANAGPHPADGKYSFNSSAVIVTAGVHF